MRTFEYSLLQHAEPDATNIREFLNERGAQGWELVQIIPNTKQGWIYVFKRETASDESVTAVLDAVNDFFRFNSMDTTDVLSPKPFTLSEHGDKLMYKLVELTHKDQPFFSGWVRHELRGQVDLTEYQCGYNPRTTLREYVHTLADMLDD